MRDGLLNGSLGQMAVAVMLADLGRVLVAARNRFARLIAEVVLDRPGELQVMFGSTRRPAGRVDWSRQRCAAERRVLALVLQEAPLVPPERRRLRLRLREALECATALAVNDGAAGELVGGRSLEDERTRAVDSRSIRVAGLYGAPPARVRPPPRGLSRPSYSLPAYSLSSAIRCARLSMRSAARPVFARIVLRISFSSRAMSTLAPRQLRHR